MYLVHYSTSLLLCEWLATLLHQVLKALPPYQDKLAILHFYGHILFHHLNFWSGTIGLTCNLHFSILSLLKVNLNKNKCKNWHIIYFLFESPCHKLHSTIIKNES